MCTALVVGNMIGSGIFLLPASLAPYGAISIVGWVVTSFGAIVLALIFGRLARIVSKAGGPYAYTREGFGEFPGFLIALGVLDRTLVGQRCGSSRLCRLPRILFTRFTAVVLHRADSCCCGYLVAHLGEHSRRAGRGYHTSYNDRNENPTLAPHWVVWACLD